MVFFLWEVVHMNMKDKHVLTSQFHKSTLQAINVG